MRFPRILSYGIATAAVLLPMLVAPAVAERGDDSRDSSPTTTPIKHLVVIFQENVSFDHYFGTYPMAQNPPNEPRFVAAKNTPTINGLDSALLNSNPNVANPKRLDR